MWKRLTSLSITFFVYCSNKEEQTAESFFQDQRHRQQQAQRPDKLSKLQKCDDLYVGQTGEALQAQMFKHRYVCRKRPGK